MSSVPPSLEERAALIRRHLLNSRTGRLLPKEGLESKEAPNFVVSGDNVILGGTPIDAEQLCNDMKNAFAALQSQSRELREVVIVARHGEGPALVADFSVLSARMPFVGAISNGWAESHGDGSGRLKLTFPDFTKSTMQSLIEYAYSGSMTIRKSDDRMLDVFFGARYVQMARVEDLVMEYMLSDSNAANVMQMLTLGFPLGSERLKDKVRSFILRNVEAVISSDALTCADLDSLVAVISQPSLAVAEEVVAESAIKWFGRSLGPIEDLPKTLPENEVHLNAARLVADNITWLEVPPRSLENILFRLEIAPLQTSPIRRAIKMALQVMSLGSDESILSEGMRRRLRNPILQFSPDSGLIWERRQTILNPAGKRPRGFSRVSSNTHFTGNCLDLTSPGSNIRVTRGYHKTATNCMTVEAWVQIRPSVDDSGVHRGSNGVIVCCCGGPNDGWQLRRRNDVFEFVITLSKNGKTWTHIASAESSTSRERDLWTHVAGTFDGEQVIVWVDGSPYTAGYDTSGSQAVPADADFIFGSSCGTEGVDDKLCCFIAAASVRTNRVLDPHMFLKMPDLLPPSPYSLSDAAERLMGLRPPS